MLSKAEKIILTEAWQNIRRLYIMRALAESDHRRSALQWLANNGIELLDIPADQHLTDDGREVLRAHGKAYALRPEMHAKRLAVGTEQARQRDHVRPPDAPTCVALIDGQLCGGTLVRAAVCPRCALGKSGVTATLTCDVCDRVTAIMRGAS